MKQSNEQTIDKGFNIINEIKAIQKSVHPDLKITFKTRKYLNQTINHLLEKVTQKMEQIVEKNDQKVICCADIEKILSCFPMKDNVIKAAYKCVAKLHSNEKYDLFIPINTIRNYIQIRITDEKINDDVYYFIDMVIDELLAEVLEISGNVTRDLHRERISLRSTIIASNFDEELDFLFKNTPYSHDRCKFTTLDAYLVD